jgi:hypothetical protein
MLWSNFDADSRDEIHKELSKALGPRESRAKVFNRPHVICGTLLVLWYFGKMPKEDQEKWELMMAKAKSFLRDLVDDDVVKMLVELMEGGLNDHCIVKGLVRKRRRQEGSRWERAARAKGRGKGTSA